MPLVTEGHSAYVPSYTQIAYMLIRKLLLQEVSMMWLTLG